MKGGRNKSLKGGGTRPPFPLPMEGFRVASHWGVIIIRAYNLECMKIGQAKIASGQKYLCGFDVTAVSVRPFPIMLHF